MHISGRFVISPKVNDEHKKANIEMLKANDESIKANICKQLESFEKHAPHSRYFSDELGALFIYNNIEHMFTCLVTYGIIFIWKKIYLLLKKILFRMVEDMCTRFNIIWSGARNTERKF